MQALDKTSQMLQLIQIYASCIWHEMVFNFKGFEQESEIL